MSDHPYLSHLESEYDLITTYDARRAGFVALALEKNRRATPFVREAQALYAIAGKVSRPADLIEISDIHAGLLTAAGLSDKARIHLQPEDKTAAINGLIKNFLEPAGDRFVEELVYRFLLIRGDTLGGSMRNVGGLLAQQRLSRAIIATLSLKGLRYRWLNSKNLQWYNSSSDDTDIEIYLRGLSWQHSTGERVLIYNAKIDIVRSNVDLCLFNGNPENIGDRKDVSLETYLALGELKGGIDPAGADEHWKTARTALERIREAFTRNGLYPSIFFISAAIEKRMAGEIWSYLKSGLLTNAANLNENEQMTSISRWICNI